MAAQFTINDNDTYGSICLTTKHFFIVSAPQNHPKHKLNTGSPKKADLNKGVIPKTRLSSQEYRLHQIS